MIKHIVFWKLAEQAEGASKAENAEKIRSMLLELPSVVPGIRAIEVGFDFNRSDAAYDVALYSEFDTRADLDAYQKHPAHVRVADFVAKIRTHRAVVDYEV